MSLTAEPPPVLPPASLEPEGHQSDPRRKLGAILGPALFFLTLALPLPGLTPEAHRLSAVMALVIVFWVTEVIPLPVTALLGPGLAVMLGVVPLAAAFAPFANPLIFLFIGSFIIAEALFVHRVNERIAYTVLSSPLVGARPTRILLAYGMIGAGISAWMSNTATAAMLIPIGLSLLAFMEREGNAPRSYGISLLMATTYGASRGGMMTPVGTPPNLIAVGLLVTMAGVQVSFLQWMIVAVPLGLLLLGIALGVLVNRGGLHVREIPGADRLVAERRRNLGPLTRGEKNALVAFVVTVMLWIGPGLLPLVLGQDDPLARRVLQIMPESVAALTGAILLFLLPVSRTERSTITWAQASRIDWGTILLFGGGLSLGTMAGDTGLAETLGRGITELVPTSSVLALAYAGALFGVILSETMSNTAATNIAVPVVIAVAMAAGIDPIAPAMSVALATSVADMLPVSTPPNAIVYGTGKVPITKMIQFGLILDTTAVLLVPPTVVFFVGLLF